MHEGILKSLEEENKSFNLNYMIKFNGLITISNAPQIEDILEVYALNCSVSIRKEKTFFLSYVFQHDFPLNNILHVKAMANRCGVT